MNLSIFFSIIIQIKKIFFFSTKKYITAFIINSENFLQNVFKLATNQNLGSEVVVEICRTFNFITDNKISLVEPFLGQVIKWMMIKTKSDEEEVAMEASNYWQIITDSEYIEYRHILAPNVEA